MLRKAQTHDLDRILEALKGDPSRSLFISGDLIQNGLETDYQETWLDEDADGLHGVYLRYQKNLVVYVFDRLTDAQGLQAILDRPDIGFFSGTADHLAKAGLMDRPEMFYKPTYFCECKELKHAKTGARMATIDDAQGIAESLDQIDEFGTFDARTTAERAADYQQKFREGKYIGCVMEEDGRIVSHASGTAQSHTGIMVVGVFTLKDYRQRGYARKVVSSLTDWALKQGLTPCLFYDNPQAGKLYHDLGYVTFDQWIMGKKTT